MRIRTFYSVLLIFALLLGLAGCGGIKPITAPDSSQAAGTESQPAVEDTKPPVSAYRRPQGADSVKTLLEKSLEYFRSDCEYSKIAEVHDQQACLADALIVSLYDTSFESETFTEISWEQAMEKAALILGDAETLEAKDPELARQIRERMRVVDPNEYLNAMTDNLRESFKNGEITKDDPDYEKYSQLLIDWDKGADYIFAHYPEILDSARENGTFFSLEDALELFRKYARGESFNSDLRHFKELEADYHPENSEAGKNGSIFTYDIGRLRSGDEVWGVDMLYYVEDAVYYLIGYSVWCG